MTTPINPATLPRLRELIAAIRDAASAMDHSVGGIEIHGISTKGHERAKAVVSCKSGVQRAVAAIDSALPALLSQLDAQAAEIERLRSAMLSALSATRAKVDGDISTEWLCLGADEIRLCIRRMDQERAEQTARADKAEARVAELKGLLREIRDSYHDNRAGGWPGAGDVFADAICRIDAALAKREGGR